MTCICDVYTHHIHIMYCENAWHCAMNAQNRRLDPVNSVFTVLRMHGTDMPRGMHIRACIHISMYLTKKLRRPGSKESEGGGSVHSPRKSSPLAMSSPESLASDHHNLGETLFFLIYPTVMYIHPYLALDISLYGHEQKGISCQECHIVP